ncbi:hypothetical protein NDN08_007080 [Rhodosorus marinus]|uniref:Importin N-terminal domain-containing protein n=1 Tax=Rhodosorus marinus TaxID=101924 RepID=A0AAV8UIG8_9RHOD|nr:hypothetical protein NDN08_007080 [Rhodosorus marinus]
MEVDEVEKLLQLALTPDSKAIQAAEEKLKELTKTSGGCGLLLQVLRGSRNSSTRQLAATLLRRHFPKVWAEVPAADRTAVKAGLVDLLARDEDDEVRSAISILAAALTSSEPWPELPRYALQMIEPAQKDSTRKMGFSMLKMLLESAGPDNFPLPLVLPAAAFAISSDPSVQVRINALHTYGSLLITFPDDAELLSSLPKAIEASRGLFENARVSGTVSEDELDLVACSIFEIFAEILELWTTKVREIFPMMLSFSLEEALRPHPRDSMLPASREAATEFVATCVTLFPKAVRRATMSDQCIDASFQLMVESEGDAASAFEGDLDDDETTALMLGVRLLDAVASKLPSKDVYSRGMNAVQKLAGSTMPYQRAIAYRSMAIMVDGCRNEAKQLISALSNAYKGDSEAQVRASAMRSIGALVEGLEIYELDEKTLREVREMSLETSILGIKDPDIRVRKIACASLEAALTAYADEGDIAPRVDDITNVLSQAGIPEEAVSAAAALADVAGDSFTRSPAFQGVVLAILELMSYEDEERIPARAVATASAGSILKVIRADDPKKVELMNMIGTKALQGYSIDSPELREHTHILFARLAETLGSAVTAVFAREVIVEALKSLERDDGVFLNADGQEISPDDLDLEDFDEDEGGGPTAFSVRTALMDEKIAAAEAIGAIAMTASSEDFVAPDPQGLTTAFTKAMDAVDQYHGYYHELIRASTIRLAARIAVSSKGSFFQNRDEMRKRALESTLSSVQDFIQNDDDIQVVAAALDSICIICDGLGPEAIEPFREGINLSVKSILDGTAPVCNADFEADDQVHYEEEVDERRDFLVDSLMEVFVSLCKAYRAFYVKDFAAMLPLIMERFCKKNNPPADFSAALGGIAESFNYLHFGKPMVPAGLTVDQLAMDTMAADSLAPQVIPTALLGMKEKEHSDIRRNSVFLIGVIMHRSSKSGFIWGHFEGIVREIASLFDQNVEQERSVVDNACGCLGRILASAHCPLSDSDVGGFVEMMLTPVPLTTDLSENFSVVRGLLNIVGRGDAGWSVVVRNAAKVAEVAARSVLMHTDKTREVADAMAELNAEEIGQTRQLLMEIASRVGNNVLDSTTLSADEKQSLAEVFRG